MEETLVGTISHFFAHPQVAALTLEGDLSVGDVVRFRGHTTDFEQKISSMQIDHESVEQAASGADVGIKVVERVRRGDSVFRVSD